MTPMRKNIGRDSDVGIQVLAMQETRRGRYGRRYGVRWGRGMMRLQWQKRAQDMAYNTIAVGWIGDLHCSEAE